MSDVHGRVDVYRVVYTDDSGNHTALVFKEPVEGTVFHDGEMFLLPGAGAAPTNKSGEIPQIEEGEKGVSWSWQK